MATISSPGVGSGLDVNSIVRQLVALERRPIEQLQQQTGTLNARLSAWGQVRSSLDALQTASARLTNPEFWNSRTATSNQAAVAVTAGASAPSGQFSVEVTALAQPQRLQASTTHTAGQALGLEGRLDIAIGQWSGATFAAGSTPAVSVNVAATDTLAQVAQKINQAQAGVTALVVNSGDQQRLVLRGSNTGEQAGFEIRAFDGAGTAITSNSGLGAFSYANHGAGVVGMALGQAAQNAAIRIDGVPVSSASNSFANVIDGVSLTVSATTTATTGPAQVTVANDQAALRQGLEGFRDAYNNLHNLLRNLTRVDPSGGGNNGPLQGDQTAAGLQRILRNLAGDNGPVQAQGPQRLSDVGLQIQRDGSMSINAERLGNAMNQLGSLRALFDTVGSGLGTRFRDLARGALATDGSVARRSDALQASVQRSQDNIERMEQRISMTEARLRAQYARLDSTMSGLNGLSQFVSQQLAQWNRSNN